tara:strand:- start:2766 stop:3383 length:618 start_codon:yes stop_codon:yes gene_type:complete
MGNVESQKKEVNLKETIEKNKKTVITLNKRLEHLEKKIEIEKKNALQKIKNKNKKSALINLKRKKMYEKQVDNLYSQIGNIEQQIIVLEGSAINYNVLETMKLSNKTLKKINKENNVESVENLIENIDEQINLNEEINQVLGTPIDDLENDHELLEELENLNKTDQNEKNIINQLPEIPSNLIKINNKKNILEKKALENLELLMK